jgi:hypothetical protein
VGDAWRRGRVKDFETKALIYRVRVRWYGLRDMG